jgi:hypothetical protein
VGLQTRVVTHASRWTRHSVIVTKHKGFCLCASLHPCLPKRTPVYPCVPLCTPVYRSETLCTPVYPCVPLCTPVYPCVPLRPVHPCVPLCTPAPCVPLCTHLYPCVSLCTPVYPCVPLCTPVYLRVSLPPPIFKLPACSRARRQPSTFILLRSLRERGRGSYGTAHRACLCVRGGVRCAETCPYSSALNVATNWTHLNSCQHSTGTLPRKYHHLHLNLQP